MNTFTDHDNLITPEQREMAHIRKRVERVANQGGEIALRFEEADLAFAFNGCEHELAELPARAAAVRAERDARQVDTDRNRAVRTMTEQVLKEWDQQRRLDAETEARKRLGIEDVTS